MTVTGNPTNAEPGNPNSFHKLLINDIDYTNKTAGWVGYSENCQETLPMTTFFEKRDAFGYSAAANIADLPFASLTVSSNTAQSQLPYERNGYKNIDTSYSIGTIRYVGSTATNNATFSINNPSVSYSDLQYTNMIVSFSATQYEFNHANIYTQCTYCKYTSAIGSSQPLYYFKNWPTDMIDGFVAADAKKSMVGKCLGRK